MGPQNSQNEKKHVKRKHAPVNSVHNTNSLNNLRCCYTNADQLKNKLDELEIRMREFLPDIIGITEVKPKNSQNPPVLAEYNLNSAGNFSMFNMNIGNNTGRGLLMYVNRDLDANEVKMDTVFSECLFVDVNINKTEKLLIGLVYRSESGTDQNNEQLNVLINECSNKGYKKLLIMGDFNYPSIDWGLLSTRNRTECLFLNTIQDNYMFQQVNEPTRWRVGNKPNILDLVLTNEESVIPNIEYSSPLGKSDHCVLLFEYECFVKINKVTKIRKCFDKGDYTSIKRNLTNINWLEKLNGDNVNETWSEFTKVMKEQIENHIPTKKVHSGSKSKREFPADQEILKTLKLKKKLSRKALTSNDPSTRREYNKVRNKAKKLIRKARKNYEHNMASKAKSDPKVIWKYINSKSKTRVGISDLCTDPKDPKSVKTNDDNEKANILAEFFSSVFTIEPDGEIPSLQERLCPTPSECITSTPDRVRKLLLALKPDKSPGIDGLHPKLLRELSDELAVPMNIIFNKSLTQKKVPDEWKKAQISAIFKKGDKSLAGNYRPVSLTSVVCKTLEKLVRDNIVNHMIINNLFTQKQFGFMSGRSTTLQLLSVLDKWTSAIEQGNPVDCIYMDFQKAFDTVPHNRLISKMKSYNIHPHTIAWVQDFLTDRVQRVNVNNGQSSWKAVTSGIPQGSVLGPILFVIYINDMPDLVSSDVYLFADDTKIFKIIKTSEDTSLLQKDLDKLTVWSDTWLLKFHPEKCKHMHIGGQGQETDTSYTLWDTVLQKCDHEKDIGVIVDNELTFDRHITEKVKKANSTFASLRRSFQFMNVKTFIPVYKSLVRSHLDYASSIYSPHLMRHVEEIESVQRRSTKQIPGLKNMSYSERLRLLKLPTLGYRRIRGDMIELYKCTSGIYDKSVVDFLNPWNEQSVRTSSRTHGKKIFPQLAKNIVRRNVFSVRSTNIWNSLPEDIVTANNLNTFKNRLDRYWDSQELKYDNYKAKVNVTTGSHHHHKNHCNRESSGEDPERSLTGKHP